MQVRLIRQALTDSSGYVCLCCRFRKRSFRNGGIQRRDYADLSTKAEKKDDSGDPPTFSDRVRAFLSSNHTDGASQAVTVIEDTVVPSRKTPNQNVSGKDSKKASAKEPENPDTIQEKFLAQRRKDAEAFRATQSSSQTPKDDAGSQTSSPPVANQKKINIPKTPHQKRREIIHRRQRTREQLEYLRKLLERLEAAGGPKRNRIEGISRAAEQYELALGETARVKSDKIGDNELAEGLGEGSVQVVERAQNQKERPGSEKSTIKIKKADQSAKSLSEVKKLKAVETVQVTPTKISDVGQQSSKVQATSKLASAKPPKEQNVRKAATKKPTISRSHLEGPHVGNDASDKLPGETKTSNKPRGQRDANERISENKAGQSSSPAVNDAVIPRVSVGENTEEMKKHAQTGPSELERKAKLARTLEAHVQRLRKELNEAAAKERQAQSKIRKVEAFPGLDRTRRRATTSHIAQRITSQFQAYPRNPTNMKGSNATGQNDNPTIEAGFEQFESLTDALVPDLATSAKPAKRGRPKLTAEAKLNASNSPIEKADAADLEILPLNVEQPPVPSLAYGLERVLFNPGVYQLQDPRSRVYNFDPYLQKIMPVAEFDFNALKEYITSSRDESLKRIAKEHGKRYVGSTSSMTGALAHFHFLLSQWRPINTEMLSKSFPADLQKFTELQRTPSAIFLRWKNGSYAIDADKQFASANVLSMLGKSMEKLLTLKTNEYERYRKSSQSQVTEEEQIAPESYHYSTQGDFLMRSQLDAHDPRLPGTGMFDLKTRAVVSIRMDVTNYEHGVGYQIKSRQGAYESFEREYYDMIRAAFLKYSMQVRMGRMDGIFVAFHNIERIFGFQYISLPEMDSTIHGQWDTSIGDQEFTLSLDLLNKILDKATKKFPETSLRIHFETRDAATPFMYIFAEPVTEEEVAEIQSQNDAKIQEFERNILGLTRDIDTEMQDTQNDRSKWADIEANVQEAMDKDELGLEDPANEASAGDGGMSDAELQASFEQGPLYSKSGSVPQEVEVDAAAPGDEEHDIEDDDQEGDDNDNVQADQEPYDEEDHDNLMVNDEAEDEEASESEDDNECPEDLASEVVNESVSDRDREMVTPSMINEQDLVADDDSTQSTSNEVVDDSDGAFTKSIPENVASEDFIASNSSTNPMDDNVEANIGHESQITSAQQEISDFETLPPHEMAASMTDTNAGDSPEQVQEPEDDGLRNEADRPFLEAIGNEMPSETESASDTSLLAMTLTLRNKVNDKFVLRPENMTAADNWSIEYSLAEVTSETRARALYQACQTRRQKKLDTPLTSEDEATVNYYIQNLREMSTKGAEWRKQQDRHDSQKAIQILGMEPSWSAEEGGEAVSIDQELEA